jgi:hypothetical protein
LESKVALDYIRYVRQFEDAEDSTREAREKSERDRDYRDGKQLTDTEEKVLKKRGQPIVVFNEIQPKVNTMLGLEKQTRKDPKALPRTPNDEQAAHAATDAIRYVCEDSNWDDKRSRAADNLVVEGTCAIMVGVKRTRAGGQMMLDPDIRRVAWDRFYYDPASSEQDFSDALFMGTVIWMDLDEALRKYPDAKPALEGTWLDAKNDNTYGDKPKGGRWADYKRRRVRLIEHYYNEDGWKFCIVTGSGFVIEPMASPYLDADGEPECPIKAVSLYVDRDNNRFGEVRMMISPQDEVNKRRSKALHLITMRQVRVSPSAAMDPKKVREELALPDGVFVADQGDFEVLQTNDMALGNLNLLQDAREHIHRTGANNALAGRDTAGQSGRAIIAQQQGGITESASYLDAVRILSIAVYRAAWGRIRQHWTAERWVRITDDKRNMEFVGLNRPVTAFEMLQRQVEGDPNGQMLLQQAQMDPSMQQVVEVENNIGELDVDIIVDEGVDTPTIAAEQFSELVQLAQSGIPIPPAVLIEASSLRNKDQLLQMLEQAQQQDPMAEQMKQVAMAGAVAEVENTEADTAKKTAEAQATQFGIVKKAHEAGMAA